MKTSKFPAFTFRTCILFMSIAFCFASLNPCDAQAIVGKWKRAGTKFFTKDNATGKQVPASDEAQQQYDKAQAARGYNEMLVIKSDNTYTSTVSTSGNPKPMVHNGNYILSGKDLDMKIPEVNHQKTTITIHSLTGTTMVWDMLFMGKLMQVSYTRM